MADNDDSSVIPFEESLKKGMHSGNNSAAAKSPGRAERRAKG